jgi:hypothetical protein
VSPRNSTSVQGEECPISKCQHLRDPNGYTHRCSGATVGDSHEGPLNNQGKPAYVRKKQTQTSLKRAKQTHEPTAHQMIDLATLGRNSASLEGYSATPVQLRLARGQVAPSGEVPSQSRAGRPLKRDSASLGGWTPPRARSRLDREPSTPLEQVSVSLEGITSPPPPYLLPRQGHLMH